MKNLEKFLLKNPGKTESDYREWATNCGKAGFESRKDRMLLLALVNAEFERDYSSTTDEEFVLSSNNPFELMRSYLHYMDNQPDVWSLGYVIDSFLEPFPKADFYRWGDKNNIGSVKRKWFDEAGPRLDVQCLALCHYFNNEVTEEDVIEHIMSNNFETDNEKMIRKIAETFNEKFGIKLTEEYARGLVKVAVNPFIDVPF